MKHMCLCDINVNTPCKLNMEQRNDNIFFFMREIAVNEARACGVIISRVKKDSFMFQGKRKLSDGKAELSSHWQKVETAF